jgi:hypothetical protein
LNRKIFHNASQPTQEDYLQMISHCYQRIPAGDSKGQQLMDSCIEKWVSTYQWLDSEDCIQAYTQFFRKNKPQE